MKNLKSEIRNPKAPVRLPVTDRMLRARDARTADVSRVKIAKAGGPR